jgi:hypothetical protein
LIGLARMEYRIFNAHSLKDKRSVLKRILTRAKQKYNITIAEMEQHDVWQRTEIAVATVASTRQKAERELEQAIKFLDSFPEWERIGITYEWLS